MMAESDEERLKRITSMKALWDSLAKKGLATLRCKSSHL